MTEAVAPSRTVLLANPGADLYGSDRMLLESVSTFVDAGWRTIVTVPHGGPLTALIVARGAEVEICPTPVLRKAALRPRGMLDLAGETLRAIRPARSLLRRVRPDVVYVNTVTPPLWIALARVQRIPCVVHVHEAESTASRIVLTGLNLPLLLARALIVNSEFSRAVTVSALPRLRARSQVVYNSVPGPPLPLPPERDERRARLVYVGRLSARKGPHVAIAATRLLRQRGVPAVLDLVGAVFPGYEWYEDDLRAQVTAAGLDDVVRFRGFHPEVWPFLADADIVLIPSTVDEPFGNTAVEAVLARRPVVVSEVGGLPEAVSGLDCAVLVPPEDPLAVAAAVERIWREWPAFVAATERSAHLAERRYSPDSYGSGVLAAVGTALATRGR